MKIDTKDILSTNQAAEGAEMDPGKLVAYVKEYPHLMPPRCGRMYLWTMEIVRAIVCHREHVLHGVCIHCEKSWNSPDPEEPRDHPELKEGAQDAG